MYHLGSQSLLVHYIAITHNPTMTREEKLHNFIIMQIHEFGHVKRRLMYLLITPLAI
jgi:hypothetical protein